MSSSLFQGYLQRLADTLAPGDAREESLYEPLSSLLEGFAKKMGRKDTHITTLPRQTEGGNPDFRIWDGRQRVTGYIEAKWPGTNLKVVEDSDQLQRYRETFPNLILTDFFEFRLYRESRLIGQVRIGRMPDVHERPSKASIEEKAAAHRLFEHFFGFSMPRAYSAESLALALAKRTRFLRDVVHALLEKELGEEEGNLLGFYEAFKEYLIADLEPVDFADLYAQTLTFGLFAARIRTGDGFNRATAAEHIPKSIGILHEIFRFISYGEVPEPLAWMVDDIAEVLAVAEAGEILDRYYRQGKGTDPVIHFYETFLAEYDPDERERKGVYYTPEPVVSYIVRSLHHLLKERFGKADGLASSGVTLLDPAAGTMTFVARATREAVEEFAGKYGDGAVQGFLTEHVLENFYAFELMVAPYALGHMKMSFLLEEMGYRLGDDERFRFYLTNTLEMEELEQTRLPGLRSLAKESHLAGEVKKETPILVILGNPPYSVYSTNRGEWITNLMQDYKRVAARSLGEANLMPLQDDYVKFLRFAEWKIDEEGDGVVGMITNHSWLDNPTFRGMRWHLLRTYDEIWVLDLHGNSLRRETTPERGKDENVFDIRQGVAISFFLKRRGAKEDELATVYHADLWGLKEEKYSWLEDHDVGSTEWADVTPIEEFYLYLPRDEVTLDRYNKFPSVKELFPVNSTGIKTHRDSFVIDIDRKTLEDRVRLFRASALSDDEVCKALDLRGNRDWKVAEKRKRIHEDKNWEDKITRVLYRPFDVRWIFYHPHAVDFGREEVMSHTLMGENLALCIGRAGQVVGSESWNVVFCSDRPTDHNLFYRGGNQTFPLFLHSKNDLFNPFHESGEPRANFHSRLLPALEEAYGRTVWPEEVFHYVYAVLYAYSYREKYQNFLKIDFPRIPFTQDLEIFTALADLGSRLSALHLLESPHLDPPMTRFHGEGDNRVTGRGSQGFRYHADRERMYINKDQYFGPIPLHLWEYQIGGYQVLRKWLRDRKERSLTTDEIRTYCRIVTALRRTVELQEEIDALYPQAEADVVALNLGKEASAILRKGS